MNDGQSCGVMDSNNKRSCELAPGHDPKVMHKSDGYMWKGDHGTKITTSSKRRTTSAPAKASPKKAPAAKPAPAAPVSKLCDARWSLDASGTKIPHDHQVACGRDPGHAPPHRGFALEGNHVSEWTDDRLGGVHISKDRYDTLEDPSKVEAELLDDPPPPTAVQDAAVAGLTILGYRRHPAAALFPMLEGEAFDLFAGRIQANGLREPIVLVEVDDETWILDGSNRALACEQRGVAPRFEKYEGPTGIDALRDYSLDKNGEGRRHLDPSVRAIIAADAALLGRGNPGDRETGRSAGLMTQAQAGKRLGVSERLVRRAVVVRDKGTAKVNEAVRKGRLAVDAALELVKLPPAKQDEYADEALAKTGNAIKSGNIRSRVRQEERRAVVAKINTGDVTPISSLPSSFGLLLWDPPWEYGNSDDHAGARGHIKYPSMPLDKIAELGRELLTHLRDDAVIVTWGTNPRMPLLVHLVEALGLEWQSMGTWVKGRIGVAPLNMRSRTEHYAIATRGKPVHTLNELSTWLADRPIDQTGHSEKPTELHAALEQHCSGPFLEVFARGPREGWITWGAESNKFAAAEAA